MLIKVYEENPNPKRIQEIVECLRRGGVIVYPTDTVYSFGCDLKNHKALEKIATLKGLKPKDAKFSIVCYDLSHLSDYAKALDNNIFKMMKRTLPGAYTFILNASMNVPKIFKSNKKTIGIRVPDNDIARAIVKELGNPIITSSVNDEDEVIEYTTDPELIEEKYRNKVDLVVDGGYGNVNASTVVDCTENIPVVIREGIGDVDLIY